MKGKTINSEGYVCLYRRKEDSTPVQLREHIVVMEEYISRKLKPNELVHHIDRNKTNNNIENLLLFDSHADHSRFHGNGILIVEDKGVGCKSPKTAYKHICNNCNKIFFGDKKNTKYCCSKCRAEASRVVKRPDKKSLKALIVQKNINEIARTYGVSGNAVRKWLKAYKLPYKSEKISKLKEKVEEAIKRKDESILLYSKIPIVMETDFFMNKNKRKSPKIIVFPDIYEACDYVVKNNLVGQSDYRKIRNYIIRVLNGERKTFARAKWYSMEWNEKVQEIHRNKNDLKDLRK